MNPDKSKMSKFISMNLTSFVIYIYIYSTVVQNFIQILTVMWIVQ